jgi:hypothetical protein
LKVLSLARGGGHELHVQHVLYGHREPGEPARGVSARALFVEHLGALAGAVEIARTEEAELGLQRLGPRDGCLQQFGAADPAGVQGVELAGGVEVDDLAHARAANPSTSAML